MTYDASTPACGHCKNPHTEFGQAQLIFWEQKEMPMVQATIHEDSSHKFEEIPATLARRQRSGLVGRGEVLLRPLQQADRHRDAAVVSVGVATRGHEPRCGLIHDGDDLSCAIHRVCVA